MLSQKTHYCQLIVTGKTASSSCRIAHCPPCHSQPWVNPAPPVESWTNLHGAGLKGLQQFFALSMSAKSQQRVSKESAKSQQRVSKESAKSQQRVSKESKNQCHSGNNKNCKQASCIEHDLLSILLALRQSWQSFSQGTYQESTWSVWIRLVSCTLVQVCILIYSTQMTDRPTRIPSFSMALLMKWTGNTDTTQNKLEQKGYPSENGSTGRHCGKLG